MRTERALQAYFLKQARKLGMLAYKTDAAGVRGFPDVTLVHAGRAYFIELKTPAGTGKLSLNQIKMHSDFCRVGMAVAVLDSKAGCDAFLLSIA